MAKMRDGMLVVEVDVNEWAEVESEQMIVVVDEVEVMAKMEGGMLLVDQRSMEESGQPQVLMVVDDAVLVAKMEGGVMLVVVGEV